MALDLNFLNLWAGTKWMRTFVVDNTSEKSLSPPWSRKCCRSQEKYHCAPNKSTWVNLLVFVTSKNLQDTDGGREHPQEVTILQVSALALFPVVKTCKKRKTYDVGEMTT